MIDSASEEGLLTGTASEHWHEAKTRIVCGATYEGEAGALHELLKELARTGALAGSWIDDRWRSLEAGGEENRA